MADLFRNGAILPDLVFLGSSTSEKCGQAVAEAGVRHVVAVGSGCNVSGTIEIPHFHVFPVMSVGVSHATIY